MLVHFLFYSSVWFCARIVQAKVLWYVNNYETVWMEEHITLLGALLAIKYNACYWIRQYLSTCWVPLYWKMTITLTLYIENWKMTIALSLYIEKCLIWMRFNKKLKCKPCLWNHCRMRCGTLVSLLLFDCCRKLWFSFTAGLDTCKAITIIFR